jgi:hypothetical protein
MAHPNVCELLKVEWCNLESQSYTTKLWGLGGTSDLCYDYICRSRSDAVCTKLYGLFISLKELPHDLNMPSCLTNQLVDL